MPKRDPVLAKLGLNVRKRREARELTQENLAERAGLDATYISRHRTRPAKRIFLVVFNERRVFEFPAFPKEGPKLESILETDVPDKYPSNN